MHAFVRRSEVGPKDARKLLFYVTSPVKQICGVADFVERVIGNYRELWNSYGNETCFKSFDEYKGFLENKKTVTFIRFREFNHEIEPVSVDALRKVLDFSRMPQMGKYIDQELTERLIR
jgi:predicted transcriptional regulator